MRPAGYETEVAAEPVDGEQKEPSLVTTRFACREASRNAWPTERWSRRDSLALRHPRCERRPRQRCSAPRGLRRPLRIPPRHRSATPHCRRATSTWPAAVVGTSVVGTSVVGTRSHRASIRRYRRQHRPGISRPPCRPPARVEPVRLPARLHILGSRDLSAPIRALDVGSVTGMGTSGFTVSSFRTAPIPGSSIARLSTTARAWSDATVPVSTAVLSLDRHRNLTAADVLPLQNPLHDFRESRADGTGGQRAAWRIPVACGSARTCCWNSFAARPCHPSCCGRSTHHAAHHATHHTAHSHATHAAHSGRVSEARSALIRRLIRCLSEGTGGRRPAHRRSSDPSLCCRS